jgi:hypothetical protein
MFFTFRQNNSGGGYDRNANVDKYVIIEADTADDAWEAAKLIGLYDMGVDKGIDCECCGDRWNPSPWRGRNVPSIYGEALTSKGSATQAKQHSVVIHYADGRRRYTKPTP